MRHKQDIALWQTNEQASSADAPHHASLASRRATVSSPDAQRKSRTAGLPLRIDASTALAVSRRRAKGTNRGASTRKDTCHGASTHKNDASTLKNRRCASM